MPLTYPERPVTIGEHIRRKRMDLKLFQADLAKLFGVCEDSITGWESGRSVPLIQFYPELIQFLGYYPLPFETESLGGRINKFRFENGLSHKKLGKMMGVDATTIGAWETNKHVPNNAKLKRLEELLNSKVFF